MRSEPLPAYEVVSLTPDIYVTGNDGKRKPVAVSMAALAAGSGEGDEQVERVLALYGAWIEEQEALIQDLPERLQEMAQRHVVKCRDALGRMQSGWALVKSSPVAERAFRLANEAMLFQQVRSRLPRRLAEADQNGVWRPVGPHPQVSALPDQGKWRPFQIAFVLATLPELVELDRASRSHSRPHLLSHGRRKDRGLPRCVARSACWHADCRDPSDTGTDTLMRYTLRLLTAQQFLRAASLICVLEDIRSQTSTKSWVTAPFGIGVWLGRHFDARTHGQQAITALSSNSDVTPTCSEPVPPAPLPLVWHARWEPSAALASRSSQDVLGYEQVGREGHPPVPGLASADSPAERVYQSTSLTRTSTTSGHPSLSAPSTSSPCMAWRPSGWDVSSDSAMTASG
ncbi:MAG: hypothetical protein V9F03_07065 [Microthrixaceae bacterium]